MNERNKKAFSPFRLRVPSIPHQMFSFSVFISFNHSRFRFPGFSFLFLYCYKTKCNNTWFSLLSLSLSRSLSRSLSPSSVNHLLLLSSCFGCCSNPPGPPASARALQLSSHPSRSRQGRFLLQDGPRPHLVASSASSFVPLFQEIGGVARGAKPPEPVGEDVHGLAPLARDDDDAALEGDAGEALGGAEVADVAGEDGGELGDGGSRARG